MSSTYKAQSFSETNIKERTALTGAVAAGQSVVQVQSTEGYIVGDILYLGALSREGCEKAVILTVTSATSLTLTAPVKLDHAAFDPATSVLGDLIHVYRAANVDGDVPADELFTVLATRNIDPDQLSSYYTDSSGSSAFWYRSTYFNASTMAETSLKDSPPVRGDDFGHYATISAIRSEAGFTNSINLSDLDVDQQRRAAETEINSVLASHYTTPFKRVPDAVRVLTEKLAAALLKVNAYGSKYQKLLDDARAAVQAYADGALITDVDGNDLSTGEGISSYFGEEPRSFTIGQTF